MAGKRTNLVVGGVPVTVAYGAVRHLRMTIRPPDGRVRVSAPTRTSEATVIAFVESRIAWVLASRERLTVPDEDGVRVWGDLVRLNVQVAQRRPEVQLTDDALIVRAPSDDQVEAIVQRWRARVLAEALDPLISGWQGRMGVQASAITTRRMTSRWGSCNRRTGRLTFNTELTKRPLDHLEYVVVHELAHLIAANHGPEFQAVMDAHLPSWRARRRALNTR